MANPHGTPIWYELMTKDPRAAKTFYDEVVGWTIEPEPAGEIDYRMITTPGGNAGGVLTLTPEMLAHGAKPGWYVYLGVDDVDATVEQAKAAGATVFVPPWTIEGVGRMSMLADPQGVPFYVMRGVHEDRESDVFSPTERHRVSWNELVTTDQAAGIAFYTGLFGWTVGGSMPMGDMGDYTFLNIGELPLGAAMTRGDDSAPAWRFYTRVPAIDDAVARIAGAGGKVLHGPVPVPGGDRVILANDPEGVFFGLVGA